MIISFSNSDFFLLTFLEGEVGGDTKAVHRLKSCIEEKTCKPVPNVHVLIWIENGKGKKTEKKTKLEKRKKENGKRRASDLNLNRHTVSSSIAHVLFQCGSLFNPR